MSLNQDDLECLEEMLDRSSLGNIVRALSLICADKADHVRGNWQDEVLGKYWDKHMKLLDDTAARFE